MMKNNNINHILSRDETKKLLLEFLNSDTIDFDTSGIVNEMKKEKVLKIHDYQITPPKAGGKRWSTYYKTDDMNERKKITSYTEKGLYAKLYEIYFPAHKDTLGEVFEQWMEKRRSQNLSPRTLSRDRQRWNRYFANRSLAEKTVKSITTGQVEDTVHSLISEYHMKEKELKAVLGILRGCMKFALKENLIAVNPMNTVEINKAGCMPTDSKHDRSRVYLMPEQQTMFQEIARELQEQPDNTDAIAIQLEFKLGLRIGELCALKFSDIDTDSMTIHIQRMESIDENGHVIVVDHLKKKSRESNRFLPIGEYELKLFEQVRKINEANGYKEDDFIFVDEKGRTHIRAIDNRIRKLCRRGGIPEKSCHDIRRTVASVMHKNGVSVEQIRFYMGHNDVNTTWGYIYDIDTEEETNNIIKNALSELNYAIAL